MSKSDLITPIEASYLIKCVKAGNVGEVFYAYINDREFWGQIDIAAQFDDLAQAVTKLDSIAAGEADEDVFLSLREQLEENVGALYVIRSTDHAIMHARSHWGDNAKVPEASRSSEEFLLMVKREGEDDLYINVDEEANIDVTANLEEAGRYATINLVREIIEQVQAAPIGELATMHDTPEATEEALAESDGWAKLKLMLCSRPADYTEGVTIDENGNELSTLKVHEKVTLVIIDAAREEAIEHHDLRTVIMIEGAHHFAFRVVREPLQDIWISNRATADEDFSPEDSLILGEAEARAFLAGFEALNPQEAEQLLGTQPEDEEEKHAWLLLKNQIELKRRLLEHDRVWLEMIDVEERQVVQSVWLNRPYYMEPEAL